MDGIYHLFILLVAGSDHLPLAVPIALVTVVLIIIVTIIIFLVILMQHKKGMSSKYCDREYYSENLGTYNWNSRSYDVSTSIDKYDIIILTLHLLLKPDNNIIGKTLH